MSRATSFSDYWGKFSTFVNGKTLRERVIILLVVVVLIYGIADLLFFGAILESERDKLINLNGLVESNQIAQQEVQALLDQMSESRLAMQRQQKLLNEKLIRVDQQLASAATGFIPATLMPKVLEQLLDSSTGLVLIKLKNKPVEKITGLDEIADSNSNSESESKNTREKATNISLDDKTDLYRHGVELQLQGSYLATLAYLKQVESLEWRFEWDALSFDIQDYPMGVVTIEVYTYSTERDWIGV